MPESRGLPKLQTLGEIAIELSLPYRRLRYLTHMRGKKIKPYIVLGAVHYYGPDEKRVILDELEGIAEYHRDRAARREAVPA